MSLTTLLLLSFVGLAGLGLFCWLALHAQARHERFRKRTGAVTLAYARHRPDDVAPLFSLASETTGEDIAGMAASVFGFDPARADRYPVRWWIVLGVALAVVWEGRGIVSGLLGVYAYPVLPLAWIMICRTFFSSCEARRTSTLFRQFPDALAMIVRSVRVGIPVSEAVRVVGRESVEPTATEFTQLANQLAIGRPLEEALRDMASRNNVAEYRFFATALSLQAQTGGGLAETLENLADVIRKRVALKARGKALASEARTSAGILAALPILTGLALWFLNPEYISVLFTTTKGEHILGMAVGSLFCGIFVMRTIITKSLA